MRSFKICIVTLVLLLNGISAVSAQMPPFRLQANHITGLNSPILLTHAKDGTRRKFIVQQGGIIRVVQPGSTTPTEFMNITPRVLSGGERGLLGLAFHPQFATNGYFFVNYTRQTDGDTIISRFRATNNNTVGDPNSERILMTIDQPFSNHNGGMIAFGPDGYLYIGMGDGGSGNDPGSRAQNINEHLGKFLRIIPDVSGVDTNPAYTNPSDNPYVGVAGADEIYAIGLRNPWRWSFDRGGTNELWAGDVGQGSIEEVSKITRGGNFGWRAYEGTNCTNLDPSLCSGGSNPITHIPPVLQYSSAAPDPRCSVTGGYVYRGTQNALSLGMYIYADYCTGEIFRWPNSVQTPIVNSGRNISSFGEDEDGELYVVGLGGTIDKILGNDTSADFDGDLRTDVSVFRPSNGAWYRVNSGNGTVNITQFGLQNDVPTPKDYDGDGRTDLAVFRPGNGTWYYVRSSDSTVGILQFGAAGDIPAAGDYDGDARSDFTVYRPASGEWYTFRSSDFGVSSSQFGLNGDIPTPGDFDGDGRFERAVWRPSTGIWYRLNSSNGSFVAVPFGLNGDTPAQADYDGDLRSDIAIFRPTTGVWYIIQSSNGSVRIVQWGINGDTQVTGDYDGDGLDDLAVYRPSNGTWYALRSTNQSLLAIQFGIATDLPIPSFDKP